MTPDWPVLLSDWHWEPSVILGVIVALGAYLATSGVIRMGRFSRKRLSWGQIAWFCSGLLLLFIALVSPLDAWSDEYLFSAHMAQHLLLMLFIPPMFILGFPEWILRKAGEIPRIRQLGRSLTRPIPAFFIFNAVFIAWHIPVIYEAALANQALHITEHLSFLIAGVINWWPIFSLSRDFPPISSGLQIVFLFLEGIPSTVMTGIIVFASDVLYPTYADAPRVFGISAHDDQQLAGVGMGTVSMIFYLGIMTYVFFRWMRLEEQRQQQPDLKKI